MYRPARAFGVVDRLVKGGFAVAAPFVLLIAAGLVTQGSVAAQGDKKDTRRAFYLTPTRYDGSGALAACASGYHMASMMELLDPSHLRYDTALGVTQADSGSGPPTLLFGWVRTNRFSSRINLPGAGNCAVWTSNSQEDYGTAVMLSGLWGDTTAISPIEPWSATSASCNQTPAVWCIQD